jgi:hypothetical protein
MMLLMLAIGAHTLFDLETHIEPAPLISAVARLLRR